MTAVRHPEPRRRRRISKYTACILRSFPLASLGVRMTVLVLLFATTARAECIGRPSETMRGWKSIAAWTLPGDTFGVAYLCTPQNQNRKIVVQRYTSRFAPDVRYVSDITLPKLNLGEMLIANADCTRDGAADAFVVPFGNFTKNAVHVQHAWRIEVPSGRITTIEAKSVRCDATRTALLRQPRP